MNPIQVDKFLQRKHDEFVAEVEVSNLTNDLMREANRITRVNAIPIPPEVRPAMREAAKNVATEAVKNGYGK